MKTIYIVYEESTSWNSITGESTDHTNISRAYLSEDDAKAYCKERNTSPVRFGYYQYESCDLLENLDDN